MVLTLWPAVVNFILDKKFQGFQIQPQMPVSPKYGDGAEEQLGHRPGAPTCSASRGPFRNGGALLQPGYGPRTTTAPYGQNNNHLGAGRQRLGRGGRFTSVPYGHTFQTVAEWPHRFAASTCTLE